MSGSAGADAAFELRCAEPRDVPAIVGLIGVGGFGAGGSGDCGRGDGGSGGSGVSVAEDNGE